MRTMTKKYIIYDYNDLLIIPELKQKVLEKHWNINLDWFDSDDNEYRLQPIIEKGFLNPTIYYDLSCSQGSGACFECTDFNFELLLKDYNIKHKKWIIDILENYCDSAINKRHYATFYTHLHTRYFDIFFNDTGEHKRLASLINKIDSYIEGIRQKTCNELYENLMAEYEYLTSEEGILETIQANEYEFYEDGTIC